ncbi:MAG: alpha/beta hydrolase [Lentisphaeria bacterium]|nr:alpha/beta hydrolase [Lentisphaeria bacterium]
MEENITTWYGFKRINFQFMDHEAFIVEPYEPLPEKKWNWCMEWPGAFVERCGALELLKRGYYHVHVKIYGTWASPEGMKILDAFYKYLVNERGFAPKVALMGLSMGGLYSYRFAMEYPERVAVIYGDAAVCDLVAYPECTRKDVYAAYGCTTADEMRALDLNPIDHLDRLAAAQIPLINVVGLADEVVIPAEHIDILELRYRKLGGKIKVLYRPYIGHHPHGYDDSSQVVDFIEENYKL